MDKSSNGNIVLDKQIKAHDGWVARVKFLCDANQEKAQSATALHKKNVNGLHVELCHPSKATLPLPKQWVPKLPVPSSCEDCALEKAKKSGVNKKAVAHL